MKIDKVVVGPLQENCYILTKNNKVLIIDPGDEYLKIKEKIKGDVIGILITHNHFDHVGALNELLNDFNVKVYDNSNLNEGKINLGEFQLQVIKTHGHSSDSITFYFYNDSIMFTGDFLFKDSIGRTDLPSGDMLEMKFSIEKIKEYDDNITVYPGHGDITNLGYEKINNYYFI